MQISPTRFQVQGSDGVLRRFTVDSQVMDYVEPARAFGLGELSDAPATHYQPRLQAMPDRSAGGAAPMVLALDRQRRLTLVRRGGVGSAGWQRIDLSAQFAAHATGPVTAFGAAWHEDAGRDHATLVAAVQTESGASRVFIAYDIDLGGADWQTLDWCDYGVRAGVTVGAVRVWRNAQGVWLTMLSGADGFGQQPYLIRSDRPRSLEAAFVFSPATDLDAILDLQAGAWRDAVPLDDEIESDSILHVLGTDAGGARVLYARPVEFDAAGQPQVTASYPMRCPEDGNVLALGLDRGQGRGADLYVGGRGVTRIAARQFAYQENARQETVMPATFASPVRRLLAAENEAGAATVWALLEDGRLFMARRAGADAAWSSPVAIRRDVADIASGAAAGALSGSILVVYEAGDGTHLWRDDQGIWHEAVLVTADSGDGTRINCMGTQLCIMDGDGVPQAGLPLTLRASVPSSLVVNGQQHYVGPGMPLHTRTGATGAVAIFNRALSFAPATYRIELDGMGHCLDINPATALYQRFGDVTADQLRAATLPGSDEPLLAAAYRSDARKDDLDALAATLRAAAQLGLDRASLAPGVRLVAPGARFSSAVSPAALPAHYGFGLATDAGGALRPAGPAPAGDGDAVLSWLGDSVSDFLESVRSGVEQAVGFVVRVAGSVVEVVCTVGKAVKRFVLSCLEQIGSFFEWIWDGLCGVAGKVWDYVKFLFDWGDIIGVRNKVAEMIEDDLQDLSRQIGSLKEQVGEAFDETLATIRGKAAQFGVPRSPALATQPPSRPLKSEDAVRNSPTGDVMGSGPGAWVMDQIEKIGRELVSVEYPPGLSDQAPAGDLAGDLQDVFTRLCEQLGANAREVFGKDFHIADLDAAKLQRLILAVCFDLAEGALGAVKAVAVRAIEALEDMIRLFRRVMYATIRLPFVEKLLKLVGVDVDTSFRLIDVVLLAPAVLTTVTYKIAFGKGPLQDVLAARLPPMAALTVQSSRYENELRFIKDVAATYVSFAAILLDAGKAAIPNEAIVNGFSMPLPKEVGVMDWVMWGLGALAHLVGNLPLLAGRDKPAATKACDWAMYVLGAVYVVAKGGDLFLSRTRALHKVARLGIVMATIGTGCYALQLTLKTIGYVMDDAEARDGLEFVQFCGRTAAQGLLQFARLDPDPTSREIMVIVGAAGAFYLNVIPGIARSIIAMGKRQPPAAPAPLLVAA